MRIHAFKMDRSFIKAVKDALSYGFQNNFRRSNNGLRSALFYVAEKFLVETAYLGVLDDMFERNIENYTKSSTFIDAFITGTLTSSRFVRPVAKFVGAQIEKKTPLCDHIVMNLEPLPLSPWTSPSPSGFSADVKVPRPATDMTKMTARAHDDEQESRCKH